MSALQEMPTVNVQFGCQMIGWGALRNPSQNEHNRGAAIASLREERIGEQIENCTTPATAIIHNRRAMPIVGCLLGGQGMAVGTGQAVGM
jgi:hypothetical protein